MLIKVNKAKLLQTLRGNQFDHKAQYDKAIEVYRTKALEHFNACIDKIKDGGEVEHYLRLPVPEEHTEDYSRAISMMDWHVGDYVELEEEQFEAYIRNKWGWHKTFFANTGSYLA